MSEILDMYILSLLCRTLQVPFLSTWFSGPSLDNKVHIFLYVFDVHASLLVAFQPSSPSFPMLSRTIN